MGARISKSQKKKKKICITEKCSELNLKKGILYFCLMIVYWLFLSLSSITRQIGMPKCIQILCFFLHSFCNEEIEMNSSVMWQLVSVTCDKCIIKYICLLGCILFMWQEKTVSNIFWSGTWREACLDGCQNVASSWFYIYIGLLLAFYQRPGHCFYFVFFLLLSIFFIERPLSLIII